MENQERNLHNKQTVIGNYTPLDEVPVSKVDPTFAKHETGQGSSNPDSYAEDDIYAYEEEIEAKPRRRGLAGALALVLFGSAMGWGLSQLFTNKPIKEAGQAPLATSQAKTQPDRTMATGTQAQLGATPENLVSKKVTPSVVGITTKTEMTQDNLFGQGGVVQGVGSGVIVTDDGMIVTNAHVVENGKAGDIQIIFSDNSQAKGKVLWSDAALDLAVVKAEKTGLAPVEMGSSDQVAVGDKAIAIGNPLGMDLQSTLTSGIISGLDRTITVETGGSMSGLLQTDAAINEGNSGGALLNEVGQLIGINTAKAGGNTSGIGFAIPVDTVKPILERVMKEGDFKSVYLGVTAVNYSLVKAQNQGLTYDGEGVFLVEVMEGTAAAEAGLKKNDILTAINGQPIAGMTDLKKTIIPFNKGDTVEISYVRSGKAEKTKLTFAQDSGDIEKLTETEKKPENTKP